jgi:hypothetical protein
MKLLFHSVWVGAVLGIFVPLADPAVAETVAQNPDPSPCLPHNSAPQGDVIVLGKPPDSPYVVVVPMGGREDLLSQVRQCVPDAFQADSRLGKYIRAGAFAHPSDARSLTRHLHSLGLDARTIYDP